MKKNGKSAIILDSAHGSINLSQLALELIDTKEFQRLRRIKQLSVGSLVFPCADHTRFTHSLGTYHIMTMFTTKMKDLFHSEFITSKNVPDEEYAALEIAALLHDVGHGPFSHTFEEVFGQFKKHEEWTINILKDKSTEINKVLRSYSKEHFEDEEKFVELVVEFIQERNNTIEENKSADSETESYDLKRAFGELVSSQLDADRLDFLLRDALFTGAKYGSFSIGSIIDGLRIGVDSDGNKCIAFSENKIPDLEAYMFMRAQMYKHVYLFPQKVFSENLLLNILNYAKELHECKLLDNNYIPPDLENLFVSFELSVEEYCNLDDNLILGAIRQWASIPRSSVQESDKIMALREMCKSLLERKNYHRVFENNLNDLQELNKEIENLQKFRGVNPCWVYKSVSKNLYGNKDKSVKIIANKGRLKEIETVSSLLCSLKESKEHKFEIAFWNEDIAKICLQRECAENMKKLIKEHEETNAVECEQKYAFETLDELKKYSELLCEFFKEIKFRVTENEQSIQQTDRYYDTKDMQLYDQGISARTREKGSDLILTIKTPAKESISSGSSSALERNEYQKKLEKQPQPDNETLIKYVESGLAINNVQYKGDLEENAIALVETTRTVYSAESTRVNSYGGEVVKLEIAQDIVKYNNNEKEKDYQLEIELKSLGESRLTFVEAINLFESNYEDIKKCRMQISKYQKAIESLNRLSKH